LHIRSPPGTLLVSMVSRTERHGSWVRWTTIGAAVAAAAGLLGAGAWLGIQTLHPGPATSGDPVPIGEPLDPAPVPQALVFVSGAVVHPGLYRLSPDARVADAIAAAGGFAATADPGRLPDLAARIHDGRQINVPFIRSAGGSSGRSQRLDINTATADELAAIPGMPLGLPEAIVEYRQLWGPFGSLSQLRTDLDVDPGTVAALGRYLRVASASP
jgi:competence protein ComEA